MDTNSILASTLGASNAQPRQGNNTNTSAIPGAPPATAPDAGFGAAGVYTRGDSATFEPDMSRVREMWNDHTQRVESFRQMVITLFNQQAERQGLSMGWNVRDIEITDEMRAEANSMIEEGGYFSVEETATRLLDFAVAISGGDPSKVDVLRRAVERGFAQAERMFGGEMPEISHQTLDAVMKGFDEWKEAGSASAITLLNKKNGE